MKLIQRSLTLFLLCLTLLGLSQPVLAIPIQEIPNPKVMSDSWVIDKANILSPVIERHLNQEISQLEQANGSEIAIVTVPDTKPEITSKQFATKLFNTWGIGKKEENNGVLFLISQRDRRVEIETGTGLGEILSDRKVGEIIQDKIIPDFQQGNFDRGTVSGTEALIKILQQQPNPKNFSPFLSAMIVWLVFILFAIVLVSLPNFPQSHRTNNGGGNSNFSEGSVGFSSDGGGSSFGGGFSDGGGAGGDW